MFSFYRLVEELENHEKLIVKNWIKTHLYIWLYHGTPSKNYPNIKKEGLRPDLTGKHTDILSKLGLRKPLSQHTTGKDALSYSTSKVHSSAYGGLLEKTRWPLLVRVPTKSLESFATGILDEYVSPDRIHPKDIVFPNDSDKYIKIEKENKYLDNRFDTAAFTTFYQSR